MNKKDVLTDPVLRKGHSHRRETDEDFVICPACKGYCYIEMGDEMGECDKCNGEGVVTD